MLENSTEKSVPDERRREVLRKLEKRLAYKFRDITLLETALTHRSYANENPQLAANDNERYEFLGDAILGLCVSDLLLQKYPDFSEGTLSKIRAALVNEKPLAQLAQKTDIGQCLKLGRGEEISGGRTKESLLANALEAVIAAIYLDSGFGRTKTVLKKMIEPLINDDSLRAQYFDYKTALQEFCQKKYKAAPIYMIVDSCGPEHAKTFEVKVIIAGKVMQSGSGRSKKEAEKQAAQKAWEELRDAKR
ncbi:MAG TPA: ribonuclease III [Smithellaceae bacterium]|nr:ribonuclease III [Smithellaceae bacterium]